MANPSTIFNPPISYFKYKIFIFDFDRSSKLSKSNIIPPLDIEIRNPFIFNYKSVTNDHTIDTYKVLSHITDIQKKYLGLKINTKRFENYSGKYRFPLPKHRLSKKFKKLFRPDKVLHRLFHPIKGTYIGKKVYDATTLFKKPSEIKNNINIKSTKLRSVIPNRPKSARI